MNEIVIELRSEKTVKRFLRKPLIITEYKEQGFLFGFEVFLKLWKYKEDNPDKIFSGAEYLVFIYYLAADNYQKEHRKETDFTKEDVKEWIDKMALKDANNIAQCFADSQVFSKKTGDLIFGTEQEIKREDERISNLPEDERKEEEEKKK